MNEKTKDIYETMTFYEKVQLQKQRAEIALIDRARGQEPVKIVNSDSQIYNEYIQGGF